MIPRRLTMSGVATAFPGEVSIDFEALGDGLLALVGDNGAGKTHLMEATGPAAIYRRWPSYAEPLQAHLSPGAEAMSLDYAFAAGATEYRLQVVYDATSRGGKGETEAWLYRDGEENAFAGPRLAEVDAELAKILPSLDVLLASNFACQSKAGSFFDLPKAARKDLFVELLGLGHLQTLADRAKEKKAAAETQLEVARAELARLREAVDRHTRITTLIAGAQANLGVLERTLATATEKRTEAEAAHGKLADAYNAAKATVDAAAEKRAGLEKAVADLTEDRDAAHRRLAGIDASLADEATVTAAAQRVADIDAQIADVDRQIEDLRTKLAPVDQDLATRAERRNTLLAEHKRLSTARDAAQAAADRLAAADADKATWRLQEAQAKQDEAGKWLAKLVDELATLEAVARQEAADNQARRQCAAQRAEIEPRTAILGDIDLDHPMCSVCPLTADAKAATDRLAPIVADLERLGPESTAAGVALREHQEAITEQRRVMAESQDRVGEAQATIAAHAADQAKAGELDSIKAELDANLTAGKENKAATESQESLRKDLAAGIEHHVKLRAGLVEERAPIAEAAARAGEIAAARTHREEADATLRTVTQRLETAQEDLAALPAAEAADLTKQEQRVAMAKQALDEAAQTEAEGREAVADAKALLSGYLGEQRALGEDPTARVQVLEAEEATLARDAADWLHLEKAFGRDGIQALEIDAAGPAVTGLANDLLSSCYGPRFQIRIDTTDTTKTGKIREVFDVVILDAEAEGERKRGSGGEQVLIDEALRLAIAIFNAQRSAFDVKTLWRDETAGALSPENASRYVLMLRRAREVGGFAKVIFISHSEAVWQQADRQLYVGGGKVGTTPAAVGMREAA